MTAHGSPPEAKLSSGESHRCATGFSIPRGLSAMGWKLTAFVFLFAVWALNVGALVVGVPILVFLLYRFWSNRQAQPRVGRPHWMIYLGALLLFLSIVAVAEQGTYSPIVFAAAGVSLLVLGLFPGLVQEFTEMVAGPASEIFGGSSHRGPETLRCVELTTVPLGYLDTKKAEPKETLQRFQRLSQTFAELGYPVNLRLEFAGGLGRILPDAIKNTATKLVHRLPDLPDREAMAGAMNATEEQAAVFTALRPGEAVVSVEGHPVPARVLVREDVWSMQSREVSDADVEECMAMFYRKNPVPEVEEPLEAKVQALVEAPRFREGFLGAYRDWVRHGRTQGLRDFLLWEARELGGRDVVEVATRVLSLATAYYLPFNAEQREKFP
ncbi:MAG: hypothetical protein JRN71_02450, partial [Nitrososphaerota archaeon]|nr:hypothetical protein [Nitrososphaerota archaeon]